MIKFLSASILAFTIQGQAILASEDLAKAKPEFVYDCKSDREFITAYEFMRSHAEFQLLPEQMRKTALRVSEGCTGSAGSFISISELLLKARIDGKTAILTAQEVAASGKRSSQAFQNIFKQAFASEVFDLNGTMSLKIARRLSADFDGDPEIAAKDFSVLAKFCVSDSGKGIPRPKCAEVIQKIIIANESSKKSIGETFLDTFKYLIESKEVNLAAIDALAIAEQLASTSPDAFEVFKNTFEYAQSKSGLALSRSEAAKFATSVALNSKQLKSKINQ